MASPPTKALIFELLRKSDRSVSSIIVDAIAPFCESSEQFNNYLIPLAEIRNQIEDPLIKIRSYMFNILIIFNISVKSGETEKLSDEHFKQALLFSRLALPMCASISDTGISEFFDEIQQHIQHSFATSFNQLQYELGLAANVAEEPVNLAQPIKRKHYGDPLKIEQKKPEPHDIFKFDHGAFKHAVSYRPGASLTNMVRLRVKKTPNMDKKVRPKKPEE